MKRVLPDRIVEIPDQTSQRGWVFSVPSRRTGKIFDMRQWLESHKNTDIDASCDPKLRSAEYPETSEIAAYDATSTLDRVMIAGVSTSGIIDLVRSRYDALGYFCDFQNRYRVPEDAPVSLAVHIEHLLFCYKDLYSHADARTIIPPFREPHHARSCLAAVNSGMISAIMIPDDILKAREYLALLMAMERISPVTIAKRLVFRGEDFIRIFIDDSIIGQARMRH